MTVAIGATGYFLVLPAPLLEKERCISVDALIEDLINPRRIHRSGVRATFATNYCPVNFL
jgi:hypothetical protein